MRNIDDEFDASFEKYTKKKKVDLSYEEYNPSKEKAIKKKIKNTQPKSSLKKERPKEATRPVRSKTRPERPVSRPKRKPVERQQREFSTSIKDFFLNAGLAEYLVIFTTVLLLIVAIFTFTRWDSSKNVEAGVESLIPIGEQLSEVAVHTDVFVGNIVASFTGGQEANRVLASFDESIEISATFSSIMQDLKVKFVNKKTDELITGIPFKIEIIPPSGEPFTVTDEDKDGMIYVRDLEAGDYQVICKSIGNVKFSDAPVDVAVKDKLEYQEINIINEAKKESEIDVSQEDTAEQDVITESQLQDTVGWIASTKTPVGDGAGYVEVLKSSITDPSTAALLPTAFWKVAGDIYTSSISSPVEVAYDDAKFTVSFNEVTAGIEGETFTKVWKVNGNIVSVDLALEILASDELELDPGFENKGEIVVRVEIDCTSNTGLSGFGEKTIIVTSAEEDPAPKTVTSVTLSPSGTKNAIPNSSFLVTPTVTMGSGTSIGVTWTNNDAAGDNITYTTNADGTLTVMIAAGATIGKTETITATSKDDSSKTAKLIVKVVSPTPDISVTLNKTEATLIRSQSIQLGATVENEVVTDSVVWTTSDPEIATVSSTGFVEPVGGGEATITVKTTETKLSDGKYATATCKITVKPLLISIKSATSGASSPETIDVGKKVDLTATFTNRNENDPITWTTTDATIGKVTKKTESTTKDTYTFTALKEGTVDVKVYSTVGLGENKQQPVAIYRFTVGVNPRNDKVTKLNDNSGTQIYVKDGTDYREATYADYFTYTKFYVKGAVEYTYTGWQTLSDNRTYYFDKNGDEVTGKQVIQGVEYVFSSAGVLSMGDGTVGIDVSKWNGTIDWQAVKNSGVDFVIIRCGYRGSTTGSLIVDPKFEQNIQGARSVGLKVGVYFFTQAITEVEAVEEASLALALTNNYNLTYPIFIDSEGSGGRADGLDKTTRTAVLKAFCQTIQNAGKKTGIYASKNWYKNKLNMSQLNAYTVWVAQYATTATYTGKYDMWQYSSTGHVGGISGNVDMNKSYLNY